MFVHTVIHVEVFQRGLSNLDGKLERFVTKKWKKRLPNSSQTDYSCSQTVKQDMLVANPVMDICDEGV